MTSEEIIFNFFMKWSKTEREIHKINIWEYCSFEIKKIAIFALRKSPFSIKKVIEFLLEIRKQFRNKNPMHIWKEV